MGVISTQEFKSLVRSKNLQKAKSSLLAKDVSGITPEMLDQRRVKFTISTPDVDRHGDSIKLSAWKSLDNYMRNPVVLWAHDDTLPPLARCVDIGVDQKGLYGVAEFVKFDMPVAGPMAEMAYQMCQSGFLSATSVGFIPQAWQESEETTRGANSTEPGFDFTEADLMEFSIVPVPANPFATIVSADKAKSVSQLNNFKHVHRLRELQLLDLL